MKQGMEELDAGGDLNLGKINNIGGLVLLVARVRDLSL
jgi:hypothetical protein